MAIHKNLLSTEPRVVDFSAQISQSVWGAQPAIMNLPEREIFAQFRMAHILPADLGFSKQNTPKKNPGGTVCRRERNAGLLFF
ncbi:MAG: hypothetical protein R2747_09335 [Pyrinomonadaceae bacterium]